MRPRPMMPTVFSYSSMPVYFERFHWPSASAPWAAGMWRARLRMWPTVSSAAEMMFEVGALTTMTPAAVAALMSTLSRPTPARAMTFSSGAAAMASASTFVAERTRMADAASADAASSAARSVPSTLRTSKSGPRASTVAGESSSAISTTGFDTASFDTKIDPSIAYGSLRRDHGAPDMEILYRLPNGPMSTVTSCDRQSVRGVRPAALFVLPRRSGASDDQAPQTIRRPRPNITMMSMESTATRHSPAKKITAWAPALRRRPITRAMPNTRSGISTAKISTVQPKPLS